MRFTGPYHIQVEHPPELVALGRLHHSSALARPSTQPSANRDDGDDGDTSCARLLAILQCFWTRSIGCNGHICIELPQVAGATSTRSSTKMTSTQTEQARSTTEGSLNLVGDRPTQVSSHLLCSMGIPSQQGPKYPQYLPSHNVDQFPDWEEVPYVDPGTRGTKDKRHLFANGGRHHPITPRLGEEIFVSRGGSCMANAEPRMSSFLS